MSMISGLIDELNKSADEWNASNMFELARMCRDAADTIWQLRDDLQRANDAVRDAEHDESMAWDRVRKAEAENAKLRELVRDMHAALQAFCDAQDVHGDNCPLWVDRTDDCELRGIERDMRELGIEAG